MQFNFNIRKFLQNLSISEVFFILINLSAIWGVWFKHWNASEVFLVYCLESVIVGIFTVIKLLIVTIYKKQSSTKEAINPAFPGVQSGFFYIFFFIAHYGFFLFVQMNIFLGIAGIPGLNAFEGLSKLVLNPFQFLNTEVQLFLCSCILMYGINLYTQFIASKSYQTIALPVLMFMPYPRVFVQQFTVILGAFALAFGAGKMFILIFVLIRIIIEFVMNDQKWQEKLAKLNMHYKR